MAFAAQKSQKSSVRFLARGTAIYSSFSGSQSEYLVEIPTSKQAPFLARLLYRRAQQHPENADELIDSGKPFYLRLTRAEGCDQNYETLSTLFLPSEGGRVRAYDGLRFVSASTKPAIPASAVLPCYLLSPSEVHWKGHYRLAESEFNPSSDSKLYGLRRKVCVRHFDVLHPILAHERKNTSARS